MTFTMSLAMIAKDCADGLDKILTQAAKHFDEIVVVDTESTDGGATVAVAQKHGAKVLTYKRPDGFPWVDDFSAARNMSFDACTSEFVCWLDSDDSVVGFDRLRDCIQQACVDGKARADAVFIRYDYAFDEYGNCTTQLWRERVVRRGMFRWTAPLHEVLLPIGGRRFETAKLTGLGVPFVSHKGYVGPDSAEREQSRLTRNLAILERYEQTHGPLEIRMVLYRGNHLLGVGKHEEALACYERYIKESGWPEEVYIALLNMGRCYKGLAAKATEEEAPFLLLKALSCYKDACFSIPDHYEAHANLADTYLILGDNDKAIFHSRQALEVKSSRFVPVENPATRDVLPLSVLQAATFRMERWGESLEWGKKVAIYLPEDKGVRDMLMKCQKCIGDKETYESFLKVRDALVSEGDEDRLRTLMKSVPRSIADLGELAKHMRAPRPEGKPSLAIYCGPTVEEWSPDSLTGGIGGSEEAVIFMAYALRDLGYHVEVYGMPPMGQQGDVGGVQWLPFWCYDPDASPDIFIAWRGHDYLRLGEGATRRYLWLHDRQSALMDRDTLRLADKVFVLSKSHRGDYGLSEVPEEKIHYTANGLNSKWLEPPQNEPGKAIYASCPTRGLKTLLNLWPRIRDGVDANIGAGKAQLHVYYGFTPLFEVHARQNPDLQKLRQDIHAGMKQPGVVWHGKVGQKDLVHAFATSAAWLYPTEFPETSCITAMRAQAVGCFPVTSGFAALAETASEWDTGPTHPTDLITHDPARMDAFVEAAIAALISTDTTTRQEMAEWAKDRFSWAAVANDWHRSLFSAEPLRLLPPVSEPSLVSNSP